MRQTLWMKFPLAFLICYNAFGQTEHEQDLSAFFTGYTGSFVMLDVKAHTYVRYNKQQCRKRFSPCSTFKIVNSLIGLETGVIPDENFVIRWSGKKYPREAWNRDHTLRSAIENSVVWYYQELARRVGERRMKKYVAKLHYGNCDMSGGLDRFWLESTLGISADEQIQVLYKLHRNDLPFSQRSMDIVKDIIVLAKRDSAIFRGKTGTGVADNGKHSLGWFVGWVTNGDQAYVFATNIESENDLANGMKARAITEAILRNKKLL